jgi:hypothetical protein
MRRVEAQLQVLYESEWSTLCPSGSIADQTVPGIHSMGSEVNARAGLDILEDRKASCFWYK